MRKQDEYAERDCYALVKEAHCLGHNEPRQLTIDAYRKEQGVEECDALAPAHPQKSAGPGIGNPSRRSLEPFFMVCYDLDRFRTFVASDGFNGLYDLPADEG